MTLQQPLTFVLCYFLHTTLSLCKELSKPVGAIKERRDCVDQCLVQFKSGLVLIRLIRRITFRLHSMFWDIR